MLVYDSADETAVYQNCRQDDPLLDAVLNGGVEQSGTLVVPGSDEEYLAAHVPVPNTGWVAGARRPKQAAMSDVRNALWIVVGLNLLVAVGGGAFAAKTGGTLIGQLRRLQTHAQAIGRGDFGHVAETGGVSELAELATAFNQMGAKVRAAQEALEAANAALEERVRATHGRIGRHHPKARTDASGNCEPPRCTPAACSRQASIRW